MMKRYLKIVFWVGVVSLIIWVLVIVALGSAVERAGRNDQTQPADVIVVLGSGLRRDGRPGDALYRRSVWGARLYQQGLAPQVICTGGVGEGRPRSEAEACREVLLAQGVPTDAITLEQQSRSTEENAIYAREVMQAKMWETALLVTDSFHMLRASWIFDSHQITHYASPVPREWVRDTFYNRHFTRELLALHWQAVKELFNLPITNI